MKKLRLNINLGRWLLAILLISSTGFTYAQTEDWEVNANDFEYSMTITAAIQNTNGSYSTDNEDVIGVFDAEGVCMGAAPTSVYFSPLEANLAFVMVYSYSTSAQFTLKVYDASADSIIDVGELTFAVNQELGSLMNPYLLMLSSNSEILGCTDESAYNYNPQATSDDNSCVAVVLGCTDTDASNYNPLANTNNDSCSYTVSGCTNMAYVEYNAEASEDDGSCVTLFSNAFNQLNQTVNGLNENIASLQSLNTQLESQLSTAIIAQQNALSNLDSVVLSYESIDETIVSLQSLNQNLLSENNSLENTLSSTQQALQNSQSNISVLGDSISTLSTTINTLVTQNQSLTSENTNLSNSLSTAQQASQNSEIIVTALEDSVGVLQDNIDFLQSENSQAAVVVDSLTAIINNQESCLPYSGTIDLPEGWSMFGYPMEDSVNVMQAFEGFEEKIIIIKDEWGLAWITQYNYNALGSLQYGEGYQIKTSEAIEEFQFNTSP